MTTQIALVAAFYLLISYFIRYLVLLPVRLVYGQRKGQRDPKAPSGLAFVLLYLAGGTFWFGLAYLPIHFFAKGFNEVVSFKIWFVVPILLGLVLQSFKSRKRVK